VRSFKEIQKQLSQWNVGSYKKTNKSDMILKPEVDPTNFPFDKHGDQIFDNSRFAEHVLKEPENLIFHYSRNT